MTCFIPRFSPDLLNFFFFSLFSFFCRILVRSCLLVARIRYPALSRYDPTDLPGKISLAPSASFLFFYFLFSIFLISTTLTSLRSLSSEISEKIHENLRNYLESTEHHWVRIFSKTFLTSPARLIISERIDAWTRPNVARKRGAASVCRSRRLSRTLFFGREGGPPPPAKSAPKRRMGSHYTLV